MLNESPEQSKKLHVVEEQQVPKLLQSRSSQWVLAAIAFTESILSPLIVDPFLIAMTLAKTSAWFRYALIASVWSVLGGIAGYLLGALFFDLIGENIIALYGLEEYFIKTQTLFEANVFLMTLVGAFTPIPYKIFALTGGLMKVNLLLFILASIIGRAGRFFLVGYITKRLGEHATARMKRVINMGTVVLVLAVLIYGVFTVVR